jgi:hypothetical protein
MAGDPGSHYVYIRVDMKPDALIFKESAYSRCEAQLCGACGYSEIYVTEPERLLEAWHSSEKNE